MYEEIYGSTGRKKTRTGGVPTLLRPGHLAVYVILNKIYG